MVCIDDLYAAAALLGQSGHPNILMVSAIQAALIYDTARRAWTAVHLHPGHLCCG